MQKNIMLPETLLAGGLDMDTTNTSIPLSASIS
jgi:hypothetical protein